MLVHLPCPSTLGVLDQLVMPGRGSFKLDIEKGTVDVHGK